MKRITFALFAILSLALGACTQIDTGNVGIERTLGKVGQDELPPGIYFTMFKNVDEVTTKEIVVQLSDLKPKSRDNLTMSDVDIDVYFKVTPDKAADLFVKYQGDTVKHSSLIKDGTDDLVVGSGRVVREAREAVYKTVSLFDATTMHTKRDELGEHVRKALQAALDASDKGAVLVTAINVRSLVTDPQIEQAIRERAKVDQQIQAKLKEVELAKAEAERQVEQARGEAQANAIVSASLTDKLVRIREIEAAKEAAIAVAGKAGNTVLLTSPASPLLNINK